MKWFWYSLLGFCLLMCSCKTQKSASDINVVSKENIQTKWVEFESLTDTSNALKIEIDKSKLKITETITTKKYDKDTGAITEETTTERTIAQDSDKVVTEEGNENVTDSHGLEAKQLRESTQKVDADIKEESIGGQESFGKYFGIALGVVIGILLLYLLRKNLS